MRTADQVLAMRIQEGSAGYGIYVMLLELLRDSETRSLVCNPKNLAFAINEPDIPLVERVIKDYGLFEIAPDGAFRSPWLNQQLEEYDAKKAAAQEAGRRGAAKRYGKVLEDDKGGHSDPIDTPCPTPSTPYSNKTNNTEENKIKSTKSKLLDLTWGNMTGVDLFNLARQTSTEIDDITRQWLSGKQKELDAGRGRGKHNTEALLEVCDHFNLQNEMLVWLIKFTNYGEVGSRPMVKLMEVYHAAKDSKFKPKYPSEYLLVKLLES